MKKLLLFCFLLFFSSSLAVDLPQEEKIKAKIVKIEEYKCPEILEEGICKLLKMQAMSGKIRGEVFDVDVSDSATVGQISDDYQLGQSYFVSYFVDDFGQDNFSLMEKNRLSAIYFLLLVFVAMVFWLNGWQGMRAILGMLFSLFILIFVLSKGLFHGYSVYLLLILSSILIMLFTLYPTYGFHKKSHAAMLSSFLVLIFIFILGDICINLLSLSGFASEESGFLALDSTVVFSVRDVLFAGIVVGTLGVLDDVTIGQSSVVFQLKETSPNLTQKELYQKAMKVGRDHVASMVNTLVIAYAGASFSLFLLFVQSEGNFTEIINMEIVSEEIVRMMVGSIGILLAVPLTTFIASQMTRK